MVSGPGGTDRPGPRDEPVALPRVLVAAPASGSGKTMVSTGLLAALAARGLAVSPHKVGPDYIDPGYHAAACGRAGRNLDVRLVGADAVVGLLRHGAATPTPADLAVIEGVMGLFDGAVGGAGHASSAHVAALTATPVLLIVNCASASRSVGALVHGFATFDPAVRVGGVILNNLGSARHEREARAGVAETGVPVVGALPRVPDVVVPSRHLGLVPAAERRAEADAAVAALAGLVERHVDLDAVLALARTAPDLPGSSWCPREALDRAGYAPGGGAGPRIAVAGGAAFTFSYAETLELLDAGGARVTVVDPLSDPALPPDCAGLIVGGGFPEVHAAALSDNAALRADVADFARSGGPVVAECAGLLYLARELDGVPMCGVLPMRARMSPRLALGYRDAVALTDSVLGPAGTRVPGHEFHRTRVDLDEPPAAGSSRGGAAGPAWGWRDGEGSPVADGWVQERTHASYLHVHWAGAPRLAAAFLAAAGAGDLGPAIEPGTAR